MQSFAVLCPGQGLQTATMFDLASTTAEGGAVIDAFSTQLEIDFRARASAGDALFDNRFAQPAIVAAALATWSALAPRLPQPALFAGYSVGELSAWACAGGWPMSECATVAGERAATMRRWAPEGPSGMLAVRGLAIDAVRRLADGVAIAIVNDVDHVLLAGPRGSLDRVEASLTAHGASTKRVDVELPSHTPAMRAASERFADVLGTLGLSDVDMPVVRGIDGVPVRRGADGAIALARAISEPLRWDACMRTLTERGIRVALELGPGRSLCALLADSTPEITTRSVDDFRTLAGVEQWLLRQIDD